jgi:hypothetical protein
MVVGLWLDLADLVLFFLGGSAEFHHGWLFVCLRDVLGVVLVAVYVIVAAVALIADIVVVVVAIALE